MVKISWQVTVKPPLALTTEMCKHVAVTYELKDEIWNVSIQMTASEQYFAEELFISLYKVVLFG